MNYYDLVSKSAQVRHGKCIILKYEVKIWSHLVKLPYLNSVRNI